MLDPHAIAQKTSSIMNYPGPWQTPPVDGSLGLKYWANLLFLIENGEPT